MELFFPLVYELQLSPKYETCSVQTELHCDVLQNRGDFELLTLGRLR